ncbi:MAG TPA: rod shape-determining protein RodA [Hyphomicrobiaceae bacterium]|nr:rod shape-determining protein RodA [Hyphomicrobiaceae bacterium]
MGQHSSGGQLPATIAERLVAVNWPLLALVALIAIVGIAQLQSAAGGSMSPWADKQAWRLVFGLALVILLAILPIRLWIGLAYPAYAAGLVLLVLVVVAGNEALGARRWLKLGELSLQPSEVMKIGLVLALARYYLWLPPERVSQPLWVAIPLVLIVIPVALVLTQPDLGTATLFAAVGFALMFLAGVSMLYFLGGAMGLAIASPLIWMGLHDYQRRRVTTFLSPDADPLGAGYHITQSKIAVGSGGWSGLGHLGGLQSHLDFLPEKHTDFAFAMFAEEWGFVGAASLLALYGVLIAMLIAMALACRSGFSRIVIAGTCISISIYVVINVAMVTGLVPVVGVPLPLVSYGGTAMITVMISLGLAMCAWVNRRAVIRPDELRALI